jgi:hypothetical protein
MARGRWESEANAVSAAIAMSFDSDSDPPNPYDVVLRYRSPEEEARESRIGFAMLREYLKNQ